MPNQLQFETSPYLLQHAENPVNWYPWGEEAFQRAREEDKPVFLSIGYSTCHWCHVMAHESFEDVEIASLLNQYFISIKVDKEERPDIDSIYMSVCQAFTGSGGWPTSIFMTAEQEPFLAGTYFPKKSRGRMIGLRELLLAVHEKWEQDRAALLYQAQEVISQLERQETIKSRADIELLDSATAIYEQTYDGKNGGFGRAPKFPSPHNLLFLMTLYEREDNKSCLEMAEHTLMQMYRGGIFDHIGFGFCRYSTDAQFLAPHFEKMLCDNALLILAYSKAYAITKKEVYRRIAEKTADFILREMASPEGGFYSAQDADSDGEEGKYYLFDPEEIIRLLGSKDGEAFNRHFDITSQGNFEGKSIPNLLHSSPENHSCGRVLEQVYQYRKQRLPLHLDDKILTSWNSLMIAALCRLYLVSKNSSYLKAAKQADGFIQKNLCRGNMLFVSFRAGRQGAKGFLDDYAFYLFSQLALYRATLEQGYLERAEKICQEIFTRFQDQEKGGFYLYGTENEPLILRPKETYDGAVPSGNSMMAWNLVHLSQIVPNRNYEYEAERQLNFLAGDAAQYPTGYAMFLLALLDFKEPPPKMTIVLADRGNIEEYPLMFPENMVIRLVGKPSEEFPLKDNQTTFYLCQNHSCLPPVNHFDENAI